MRVALLLSFMLGLTGCATVQSNSQPWPASEKQTLVNACQAQVWQRAESDYLKAHNQKQVLPNFRQTMNATMQPSLARCGCYMDKLEGEWSYDQLVRESSRVNEKVEQIRQSGACSR
jgi:uncharacterized protein YceK